MAENAPATAAPEAPAQAQAPAATPDPVAEAAKTLAARRAEIRSTLAKPVEPQKPAANDNGTADVKTEAKPPTKPTEPSTDELVALIQQQRRLESERKQLERDRAEMKNVQPHLERIRAAEAAKAKGDTLAYLQTLAPDVDWEGDVFWQLAQKLGASGEAGQQQPPQTFDADKLAELAAAKLAARQQAEREAAEKAAREAKDAELAGLNDARQEYVRSCSDVFKAAASKYPAIAKMGISAERIRTFAEEEFAPANGRVPSVVETLDALEAELVAGARAVLERELAAAQAAAPRSAATVTNAWRGNVGTPSTSDADLTVAQKRERIRKLLAASGT